jgi:succinate dehydrogenase flavin-adding protein (antitoxin of CptAB toxin-antitoxin module)
MDSLFSNISVGGSFTNLLKMLSPFNKKRCGMMEPDELYEFLNVLDEAKQDLDSAQKLFDSTSDPDLIEYAIYEEYAAKLKLSYLVKKAKEKDIKLPNYIAL